MSLSALNLLAGQKYVADSRNHVYPSWMVGQIVRMLARSTVEGHGPFGLVSEQRIADGGYSLVLRDDSNGQRYGVTVSVL